MVVIPGGTFTMGSPADEPGRYKYEGPRNDVKVERFAIGETEVTRGQYAQFVQETQRATRGCHVHGDLTDFDSDFDPNASWDNPGFEQTPEHPVVCVSWQDANEYAAWLTRKTGHTYRLPSEAEWEYAARAGTTTAFYWGQSADRECEHMNGGDLSLARALPAWEAGTLELVRNGAPGVGVIDCDDGSAFTSVVGRYKPNAFGLKDVSGNVWEVVADCWSETLPADGRPQPGAVACDHRVRGGSWDDWPKDLRSARRSRAGADMRRTDNGFRLVRTLSDAQATFQDCADCPRMVVIPGGTFTMGSPPDEPGRYKYEGPRSNVEVERFAIGETEITRGQYAQFVKDTRRQMAGCVTLGGDLADPTNSGVYDANASWENPGFEQTSEHPVVCVSWRDAREYAAWLTRKTGHTYRLPSEAEWEYAARAGTTTAYYWGPSADRECEHMNGGDLSMARTFPALEEATLAAARDGAAGVLTIDCDDGSAFTSVVGRYKPNAFGLRDVSGNVWEHVEDCWSELLPADGRPQQGPDTCDHRTRGGSWIDWPSYLRSARRGRLGPDKRRLDTGFRLVRTLSGAEARRPEK